MERNRSERTQAREELTQRTMWIIVLALFIAGIVTIIVSGIAINAEEQSRLKAEQEAKILKPTTQEKYGDFLLPDEYETHQIESNAINQGALVLVNSQAPLSGESAGELARLDSVYNNTYGVISSDITVNTLIVDDLNRMMTAFYDYNSENRIAVKNGYISSEQQQKIYDDAEDKTSVATAGNSDSQSGNTVEFCVGDSSYYEDFDAMGSYGWVPQNAYKYGFVQRYTQSKEALTGIKENAAVYRYVGVPHAWYMNENGLCLEEYSQLLISHTVDKPLFFTTADNKAYMVYYAELSGFVTDVYLPLDFKYEISGNNQKGVIVTVEL